MTRLTRDEKYPADRGLKGEVLEEGLSHPVVAALYLLYDYKWGWGPRLENPITTHLTLKQYLKLAEINIAMMIVREDGQLLGALHTLMERLFCPSTGKAIEDILADMPEEWGYPLHRCHNDYSMEPPPPDCA